MKAEKTKQYIYIAQARLEPSKCKIGKTNNLERRLKEYNSTTGVSKENPYEYLFACEVKDMATVEKDITNEFRRLREKKPTEIYFYNEYLFGDYVKFIKEHPLFIQEIVFEKEEYKK